MPRSKRLLNDNGLYHIVQRGHNKGWLFHKDSDFLDNCNHLIEDMLSWWANAAADNQDKNITGQLTNWVISQIQARYATGYPSDLVGICYSGACDPYLAALNKRVFGATGLEYIDVESVVLVGGPLKKVTDQNNNILPGRILENPNVKNIITIVGDQDDFKTKLRMTADPGYFNSSKFVENEINFEIKNCTHTDYFYDPLYPSDRDDFKKGVQRFIAKVTAYSRDIAELNLFIARQVSSGAIVWDGSKYSVYVERITYDE